jgi:2-C-methyl-D-erythritol 4-phosphate cytidylyltransferase/2-C-methyl-D-erythritol 2,4-cyclodiphosphate synthase
VAGSADAVVVAAGSSQRMAGVDKLTWSIDGRPLLAHTLTAIAGAASVESIVVVTTADRQAEIAAAPWLPSSVVDVVTGGERRQDSVLAGIRALEARRPDATGDRVVLVHDGARPVVSAALIDAVASAAATHGAAIPVVPVAETVKRLEGDRVVETVDRSALGLAQTPQGIRMDVLRQARATAAARDPDATWTDEAALLEACRIPVHVVPGDPSNLKVTVPADLARAADALGSGQPGRRTGIGQDSHPFGAGMPLQLGGLTFPTVPRLSGHSDGDVALHALADALLGAAGLGDLGRVFPAGPATPAGIASTAMLAEVRRRLAGAGWQPAGVDLTIIAARPRLGDRLDEMRHAIADALDLRVETVSVKASTGNLDGSEGAGRTISALALASIEARS